MVDNDENSNNNELYMIRSNNYVQVADLFSLRIKTSDEKILLIDVINMDTIENVKRKIHEKYDIPIEHQRLFFAGKELQNIRTLFSYNIVRVNILYLIRRPIGCVQIFIKTLTDKNLPLNIWLTDNVESVKLKIQEDENIPINEQRLFFAGKELRNDQTLSYYKIIEKSTIHLLNQFPERKLEIFIKTPSMKTLTLDVELNDTVKKVKQIVCDCERISVDEYYLSLYDQKSINEETTLAHHNITNGSVLYLTIRTQSKQTISNENDTMITHVDENIDEIHYAYRVIDVINTPDIMLLPIEGYENKPLVSLEEAIIPLVSMIDDIERKVWIAKQRAKTPADDLTSDESAAIILYSMEWAQHEKSLYFILNATLRDENRGLLKPWFLYLKLVLTALNKLPSVPSRTVYRGVKRNLNDVYCPGKNIIWWAFASCTANIQVLEKKQFLGQTGVRTMFAIECQNGKDIRRHSMYPNENEILLMPATQLEVIGQYQPSHNMYMIQMRETKPLFPLRDPV